MEEISEADVEAYERVRASGKWNMVMDADNAMLDMKLNPRHKSDKTKYWIIIQNYSALVKKFNIKRK